MAASGQKYEALKKAYEFFKRKAETGQTFSLQDVADHCGWNVSTPKTYLSKKWSDFIEEGRPGRLRVLPEFKRISEQQFLGQASQRDPIYTEYERCKHEHVVSFEFLLPLTREDQLRASLDELFYSDCIEQRMNEIGLEKLGEVVERPGGQSDAQFKQLVLREAERRFGGYSILHVAGRFRGRGLIKRSEVGRYLAKGERYLMDETTAVVRFIVPCEVGQQDFGENFGVEDALHDSVPIAPDDFEKEVRSIRGLFFYLFVEAVVRTIQGEDEIWMVESGPYNRVYRWSVSS